jgi:hypothetical protein
MTPAAKMHREPIMEERQDNTEFRNQGVDLFLHGMERIAEMQKQWIDVALQHNAETVEFFKKASSKVPGLPRLPVLDLASGAMKGYADTQKATIDFAVEQGRVWSNSLKDRAATFRKSTESTTNVAKETMERSFQVQKKALEHTAAQTKALVDATRRQFGITGSQADALAETFERSVDTVVDAQKELLDLVTH